MSLRIFNARFCSRMSLTLGCFAVLFSLTAVAATADSLQPIAVGPITLGDGAVVAAAGTNGNATNLTVTIDGQPASVDANGTISANIDLTGKSDVTLAVKNPATGQTTTTTIPVDLLGPGGAIPASALAALQQAGVAVNVPSTGFTSTGSKPIQVSGSVAGKDDLASLTVNGVDALSSLNPDGTFAVTVPGTSKSVVVTATDKQGSSESSGYSITPLTSPKKSETPSTASGTVAAAGANGVSIAGVNYTAKSVKTLKRITLVVTVKDKSGALVHGAKVRVRAASFQHTYVLGAQVTKTTSASGRATFVLKLRTAKFNQARRLFTVATAVTPTAQATATTSVRLPKLTSRKK